MVDTPKSNPRHSAPENWGDEPLESAWDDELALGGTSAHEPLSPSMIQAQANQTARDAIHVVRASNGPIMHSNRVSAHTAQTTRMAHKRVGSHRKRGTHFTAIIPVVVIAALIIGVSAFFSRGFILPDDDTVSIEPGLEVNLTIPDGAGGSQIADILLQNGVITDAAAFFREVKNQEAEMTLKSGSYTFITGANTREVVRQLVEGPNSTVDLVTIPEGYTVAQIAYTCEEVLGVSADDFLERAHASNYVNDYPFLSGVADDSLEGYLFPKTYDFGGKDKSVDAIIRTMLSQYQTEVSGLDFEAAKQKITERYDVEITDYRLMIMASIIEKEASLDEERANVSSVFYNRLNDWMPLQSDATVGYVIDHAVTADDLELDSPYNTYINYGLPPTPICNPGIESIKAALEPNDTNYYYFLLIDDGDYSLHVFSESLDEHNEAINKANADRS